jgi:hypothetical protein
MIGWSGSALRDRIRCLWMKIVGFEGEIRLFWGEMLNDMDEMLNRRCGLRSVMVILEFGGHLT